MATVGITYTDKGEQPSFAFSGFHHCKFFVGNAKQAATYYSLRFGFTPVGYRGLETGHRRLASHVLQQGNIFFVFTSSLEPGDNQASWLVNHGDGCQEVALNVDDVQAVYERCIANGAVGLEEPHKESDENGSVLLASVKTYGDTVHTFVQNIDYKGPFLPNYAAYPTEDPLASFRPSPGLLKIDHIVGNQPLEEMEPVVSWYEKCLGFHRFWSVDDTMIHTEYSSLKSIVVTDFHESIKMPINEPAIGKRKSQIQEYVDFYGGPGVQHIALLTDNIMESVAELTARGVDFLAVPGSYYDLLKEKLKCSPVKIAEDLDAIQKLKILVDYDDQGYLLQIFTRPVEDRPTLFYEIIQRRNHQGFGAGNFKSLFEAIEREQAKRGNL
eukprot:CAMPEP_0177655840 /NCGR_PEP_ID=MMETSP0447-20121125/15207_1 /TAXON_ID=0 /ORGANISM="Stygamoeba regulata, Strain BSH-02190019" /LENGTH=383 /DNA_ID=CAMNT_0019159837 /DNA_START=104 /DNA_END=1255 /DNA_ORIENTATION=+